MNDNEKASIINQINHLEAEIKNKRENLEKYRQLVIDLEDIISQIRQAGEKTSIAYDELNQNYVTDNNEYNHMKTELLKDRDAIPGMENELKKMKDEAQNRANTLTREINSLQSQVQELRAKIS